MKCRKSLVLIGLAMAGLLGNLFYHWESLWTIGAKYYLTDQDIIISMTTTPHRINKLEVPLQCLSRQNIKIRQIYISIPHIFKRDNMEYHIPEWLENYPNVTILRTDDYGPATKILGALKHAELRDDTIIISVDDDTCYPQNLSLRLAVRAKMYPDEAIGVSGAILDFEKNVEGGIVKIMRDKVSVPVLEGFAGIAYRKNFFADSIYDISMEPNYCYNSDDLYISFHLASQNVVRKTLNNKYLKTYDIAQRQFGYNQDALYRLDNSQAERYKACLSYLHTKFPDVKFNSNGIN